MTNQATKKAREKNENGLDQPSDGEVNSETTNSLKTLTTRQHPQLLFGEDNFYVRRNLSRIFERDFACRVQKPKVFQELANDFFSQSPDGIVMDYKLEPGWDPGPLNGAKIDTGYDVLKFCQKVNPMIPLCVYTRQAVDIPRDPSIFVIDKSQTDNAEFKREFKRFLKPVMNAHRFFGKIQPKKIKETRESEMNKYRLFLKVFKPWLHYGFKRLENPYWVTLLDRKIEMYGTLHSAEANSLIKTSGINVTDDYPNREELNLLSANSTYKPLVYWNTLDEKIITEQFNNAGIRLEKIPLHLREYFSVCMTPACVDLYFQNEEETALQRAASFTFSSQLEFTRSVFKRLNAVPKREKFRKQCEEIMLPTVFSVFSGRIDEIVKGHSGIETAWVHLKKFHSKDVAVEPFDYHLLSSNGVKSVNGLFEYAVYKYQSHNVIYSITPDYVIWDDFVI